MQKRKISVMSVKRNSAAAFRLGVMRRGLILLLFSALVFLAMLFLFAGLALARKPRNVL